MADTTTTERHTWTPVIPVPGDAPSPPKAHTYKGPYTHRWEYRDGDGRLLGYDCRFEDGEGGKEVLPLTLCVNETGATEWRWRMFGKPRPMYGLDRVVRHPEAPVVVVEGCKCADAGYELFGSQIPVVTWQGGANASGITDWTPLAGRRVLIWPDADKQAESGTGRVKPKHSQPGNRGGWTVLTAVRDIAPAAALMVMPATHRGKNGWDIADGLANGWGVEDTLRFVAQLLHVSERAGYDIDARIGAGASTAAILGELIEAGAWPHDPSAPDDDPADASHPPDSSSGPPDIPEPPPDTPLPSLLDAWHYHQTDAGSAQYLVDRYGHELRFNAKPFRSWFWYDGVRWREDASNRVYDYVDRMIRDILMEASTLDPDNRKPLEKWVYRLEAMSRQKAVVAKAETLQSVSVAADEFDRNGWLLNCLNVTLDLESGEPVPHEHRASDYLTMLAPVVYDPDATCPKWLAFVRRIFDKDEELIQFMQRSVGYSLTADVSEQKLFFAYGTGANGKTVFFETIRTLLGDYAGKAPTEMLMQQTFAQVPTDVADLRGKRFVVASEVDEGRRWAESRLKDLTGGDVIKARRMREDFFEFRQTHKLWVFGNHKPVLKGTDRGVKRRIRIIPFTVSIPEEEQIPLGLLLAELRAELPGILNWALDGYVRWREAGLGIPRAVDEATTEYFDDNDILQQFIDECCTVGSMYSVVGKKLWEHYHGWCDSNGIRSLSSKGLYRVLQERGFSKHQGTGNKTVIDGIALDADS